MLSQTKAYVNRRALSPLPPIAPPQAKAGGLHHCGDVPPIGMLNHLHVAGRLPLFSPERSQGVRCLKKPGSPMPKPATARSLPRHSLSCAQPPPQRAQARPPRRRSFMLAEPMQRGELRAVRRMQRRIEHRFPYAFRLRRLLVRLMMQRVKPGYRPHDPALFRPVNRPSVSKCR